MKRHIYIIAIVILLVTIIACKKNSFYRASITSSDNIITYDFSLIGDEFIIIPKNQTNSQSLSVLIKDKNGDLIIFDGGRVEDADHLTSIINKFGGKVKSWYLTHIHDDHIGALYKILQNNNIEIDMLYYNFADINWYYEKVGDDAGIVALFEDVLNEYLRTNNTKIINGFHNEDKYISFSVNILNDVYRFDNDPVNNSSIVYKIVWDDISMIIFGDLSYDGGKKLLNDNSKNVLKSDIVVLSHHGQNGVDNDVYEIVSPSIAIWPTSKDIYENINGKYNTSLTKKCLENIGVKYNLLSYESDFIIK